MPEYTATDLTNPHLEYGNYVNLHERIVEGDADNQTAVVILEPFKAWTIGDTAMFRSDVALALIAAGIAEAA